MQMMEIVVKLRVPVGSVHPDAEQLFEELTTLDWGSMYPELYAKEPAFTFRWPHIIVEDTPVVVDVK